MKLIQIERCVPVMRATARKLSFGLPNFINTKHFEMQYNKCFYTDVSREDIKLIIPEIVYVQKIFIPTKPAFCTPSMTYYY